MQPPEPPPAGAPRGGGSAINAPAASPRSGGPVWLCLYLPALALDAVAPWPAGLALPALVWHPQRGGQQVCQANAAARALGVQPGQGLAAARALAPQALVLARNAQREAACLQRLALALGSLTPALRIEHGDVLLEVQASLRLFGGVRALLQRARHTVRAQQVGQACWGLAATPLAARLLARAARGPRRFVSLRSTVRALQPLPLDLLGHVAGLPSAPRQMLHALGTRSLADLQALPRAGLHRRGAGPWLDALDRATGARPDPQRWWGMPEHFEARLELGHRVDHAGALEAAITPLLHALAGWLRLRWLAATGLSLWLQPEHGVRRHLPAQQVALQLATPTREAAHLQTLLRERLQHTVLAAPVDALRLVLDRAVPTAGRPGPLLPDAPDPAEQATTEAELIDRLRARLGPTAVHRLAVQADARPEKADTLRAPEATNPRTRTPAPPADPLLALRPRPAWLLHTPQPLRTDPQGQPLLHDQPLHLLNGTERIETGWHDGALVRRDYRVAVDGNGALHWVYLERGRAGGSQDEPPQHWYLHGHFA